MAWAVLIAQAEGTESSSWPAIILAVLGSSAIGAVVGGFLTAWYRGRFERDEAMRTRLIEAAEAFATAQNTSLHVGTKALTRMSRRQGEIIVDGTGDRAEWASELRAEFDATRDVTVPTLARLELLFERDSRPVQAAWASTKLLREAVWIMSREPGALERHALDPGAYEEINDACQERADDAIDANTDFARAASCVIRGKRLTGDWRWAEIP